MAAANEVFSERIEVNNRKNARLYAKEFGEWMLMGELLFCFRDMKYKIFWEKADLPVFIVRDV